MFAAEDDDGAAIGGVILFLGSERFWLESSECVSSVLCVCVYRLLESQTVLIELIEVFLRIKPIRVKNVYVIVQSILFYIYFFKAKKEKDFFF